MRRRMTALAFAGLLLLGVAGCDSDYRNGGEATATGHLPAAPNPMTLTITTFG
jgi:hypothetical protein